MKNKNLFMALLLVPLLLIGINSNAQKAPDWFYTTVNIPDFPSGGSYAIIGIDNTDFTSDYCSFNYPTVVQADLGDKVKVAAGPYNEASVVFMCNEGYYTGTVQARAILYNSNDDPIYVKTSSVNGSFSYLNGATITFSGYWTAL